MKIKQIPEDFAVDEMPLPYPLLDSGSYLYVKMWKRGYNTLDATAEIADKLKIPHRFVACSGNKDKNAVTTQMCSIKGVTSSAVESLSLKDIRLSVLGYYEEPVAMGRIKGNKFIIVIRDIYALPVLPSKFLNLFGEQRFGTNNALIGKHILKRELAQALAVIQSTMKSPKIMEHIKQYPTELFGALKTLPLNHVKFYLNAYQSKLWNVAAEQADVDKLPLVGYDTAEIPSLMMEMMKEDGVKQRDFLFREWPELSCEGAMRDVFTTVKIEMSPLIADELNAGRQKTTLKFTLPPGGYATTIIQQLFPDSNLD